MLVVSSSHPHSDFSQMVFKNSIRHTKVVWSTALWQQTWFISRKNCCSASIISMSTWANILLCWSILWTTIPRFLNIWIQPSESKRFWKNIIRTKNNSFLNIQKQAGTSHFGFLPVFTFHPSLVILKSTENCSRCFLCLTAEFYVISSLSFYL